MPRQERSDERAGRRFKRRKRKRGKRGAVSEKRGRDKSVEGKDRQFRDRKEERPGDRKGKFQRSRKRRPVRRERRQGGDKAGRDFGRDRAGGDRGPGRQQLGGIRDEINAIKSRREQFSQQRPEQVAEKRGFDPARLQDFQQGGRFQGGQGTPPPQPTNLDQVNAYDAAPEYAQPQPAPAPGVQIRPDGVVGAQPQPAPGLAPAPGTVPGYSPPPQAGGDFTPLDQPGPTAPPGIATDAYGKPVGVAPQPQPAPAPGTAPGYQPGGDFQLPPQAQPQVNPRAAGMDRFAAQPPVRRPEDQPQPYQVA